MSKIEWTDETWNPVTGCSEVSPGCDNCYAREIANRFNGTDAFPRGFTITLHPNRLGTPLRWRKPRLVFVNSMSDLFHDHVPDEFIAQVFATMAATPQHTYQILTKRHGRMRSLLSSGRLQKLITDSTARETTPAWPLRNVWLGVSAEDQNRANLRLPALLETPAAVRFVSAEPLLGQIDLAHAARGQLHNLRWVIAGGESGRHARPMHPDWVRGLRDQTTQLNTGIAFFFKQWGAWCPPADEHGQSIFDYVTNDDRVQVVDIEGQFQGRPWPGRGIDVQRAAVLRRYPKHAAGRTLDNVEHDAIPNLDRVPETG